MQQNMSDSDLIGPQSQALFETRILPLITNQSVIYQEGWWHSTLKSGDLEYSYQLRRFNKTLSKSDKQPELAFADHRFTKPLHKQQAHINDLGTMIEFGERWVEVKPIPYTIQQALQIIKDRSFQFRFKNILSDKIKKVAGRIISVNDRFTADHISRMTADANMYDRCFLVAGLAHCISIHLKTEWQPEFLYDWMQQGAVTNAFKGYFNTHVLPRLVRGW